MQSRPLRKSACFNGLSRMGRRPVDEHAGFGLFDFPPCAQREGESLGVKELLRRVRRGRGSRLQ
jgi:hypothetical protein